MDNKIDKIEARKAYKKAYYVTNKEEIRAQQKSYKQDHKEEIKAYCQDHKEESKIYYQDNREEMNAFNKVWRETNPEKVLASKNRRRAKKAGVVNVLIRDNFKEYLIEVYDDKCAYCRKHSDKYHMDHFMPLELKGHHAEYNLVLACPSCNLKKKAKHPFFFIKEQKICFTFKPYMKF